MCDVVCFPLGEIVLAGDAKEQARKDHDKEETSSTCRALPVLERRNKDNRTKNGHQPKQKGENDKEGFASLVFLAEKRAANYEAQQTTTHTQQNGQQKRIEGNGTTKELKF